MFSKTCEYGIRAAIYVAVQSLANKRAGLKDIAREIDSPEAFTAKILQQLSRTDIITSHKGPSGGFVIQLDKMADIFLSDIVLALDGDSIFKTCGLGLKECSEKQPCPVHNKFKAIRTELKNMLNQTNLLDLAVGYSKGKTYLKLN